MKASEIIDAATDTARWLEELAAAELPSGEDEGVRAAHREELRRALRMAGAGLADLGDLLRRPVWTWLDAPAAALAGPAGRDRAARAATDLNLLGAAGLAASQLAAAAQLATGRYLDTSLPG